MVTLRTLSGVLLSRGGASLVALLWIQGALCDGGEMLAQTQPVKSDVRVNLNALSVLAHGPGNSLADVIVSVRNMVGCEVEIDAQLQTASFGEVEGTNIMQVSFMRMPQRDCFSWLAHLGCELPPISWTTSGLN